MAKRGRPTKTESILRSLNKAHYEPKTPIGDDMYLPNQSGDHSAGIVRETPTQNLDIVNKKYVDDNVFSGDHADLSNVTANQHHTKTVSADIDHDDIQNTHNLTSDIDHNQLTNFVANKHIDWTNTNADFATSGDCLGLTFGSTYDITAGEDLHSTRHLTVGGDSTLTGTLKVTGKTTLGSIPASTATTSSPLVISSPSLWGLEIRQNNSNAYGWSIGLSQTDTSLKFYSVNSNTRTERITMSKNTGKVDILYACDVVGKFTAGTVEADNGFTGTGSYTNFTISGGVILAAS